MRHCVVGLPGDWKCVLLLQSSHYDLRLIIYVIHIGCFHVALHEHRSDSVLFFIKCNFPVTRTLCVLRPFIWAEKEKSLHPAFQSRFQSAAVMEMEKKVSKASLSLCLMSDCASWINGKKQGWWVNDDLSKIIQETLRRDVALSRLILKRQVPCTLPSTHLFTAEWLSFFLF